MKRVKIMLTAVTVLAVVGGALAFNAKKFSTVCAYTKTGGSGTCANVHANSTTTTTDPIAGGSTSYFATTLAKVEGACPDAGTANCANQRWTKAE